MKYIEKIKKTDKKTLVTVVGLFLLYFVIQLQFWQIRGLERMNWIL